MDELIEMDELIIEVVTSLRQKQWTLGLAESCTGGLLGAQITSLAGVSDIFQGSIVSYANQVKENLLNVSAQTLLDHGAVSEPVVLQMAKGARVALSCDCAVSVSGVAGPTGGSDRTPVGTVWAAAVGPGFEVARVQNFSGDRGSVRQQAVQFALKLLLEALGNTSSQKN